MQPSASESPMGLDWCVRGVCHRHPAPDTQTRRATRQSPRVSWHAERGAISRDASGVPTPSSYPIGYVHTVRCSAVRGFVKVSSSSMGCVHGVQLYAPHTLYMRYGAGPVGPAYRVRRSAVRCIFTRRVRSSRVSRERSEMPGAGGGARGADRVRDQNTRSTSFPFSHVPLPTRLAPEPCSGTRHRL
jgi:hypothetical protein